MICCEICHIYKYGHIQSTYAHLMSSVQWQSTLCKLLWQMPVKKQLKGERVSFGCCSRIVIFHGRVGVSGGPTPAYGNGSPLTTASWSLLTLHQLEPAHPQSLDSTHPPSAGVSSPKISGFCSPMVSWSLLTHDHWILLTLRQVEPAHPL